MSHISKIELEVTDLESLSKACQHLGINLVRDKKTYRWYGGEGECDHAITIPGAGFEIGLVLTKGRYDLLTDFFDTTIETAIGKEGGLLKQRYAVERTKAEAKRKGYRVVERQTDRGVRLYVRM
ncbi:MAG: DUF1257 domain-containing protein [Desulfobacterales bacterium]|nr:DUF1257 domain-containing protein [Desulfobacterales bacterium]